MVHWSHIAPEVQVAPQAIELSAEPRAVLGSCHADGRRQGQPSRHLGRVDCIESAAHRVSTQDVGKKEIRVRQASVGRHCRVVRPAEPRCHRAHRRMGADVRIVFAALGGGVPCLHRGGKVVHTGAAIDRPDQRQSVHDASQKRQVLANPDPGNPSGDGIKWPANFTGSCRLGVEGIDVAGAAGKPDQDHRSFLRGAAWRAPPWLDAARGQGATAPAKPARPVCTNQRREPTRIRSEPAGCSGLFQATPACSVSWHSAGMERMGHDDPPFGPGVQRRFIPHRSERIC